MARRGAHRELNDWLDQHGYRHAHATKPRTAHPYAPSARTMHATRRTSDAPKFQVGDIVRRTAARMRSMGIVSGPVNGIVVGYSGQWPLIRWADMSESDEPMAQAEEGLELDKRAMAKRGTGHARQRASGDRLFIGTFPTGIRYADGHRERGGDYLPIAFLPYNTLQLEWEPRVPVALELREQIQRHADSIRARRGED